ncbi:MAG: hypothetical protein ACO1NY_06880 [Pseudorhodoplanes sp.]
MTTAVAQTDWKHRVLIAGLLIFGCCCIVLAVLGAAGAWPYVMSASPRMAAAATEIASSPISWFSVIVLALTANLIVKSTDQGRPSIFTAFLARIAGKPAVTKPVPVAAPASVIPPDPETIRDILHLLDFGVYQTTLVMLTYLVDEIPEAFDIDHNKPLPATAANAFAHNTATEYLESVRRYICDGSERAARYESVYFGAERDAEHEVKSIPQDKRPAGIDPLLLRDYAISFRQAVRTASFLRREKREVERIVIQQRSTMIERFQRCNRG